jgi:hypothetical protein
MKTRKRNKNQIILLVYAAIGMIVVIYLVVSTFLANKPKINPSTITQLNVSAIKTQAESLRQREDVGTAGEIDLGAFSFGKREPFN